MKPKRLGERMAEEWTESQMSPTAALVFRSCNAESAKELFPESCGMFAGYLAGFKARGALDAEIADGLFCEVDDGARLQRIAAKIRALDEQEDG